MKCNDIVKEKACNTYIEQRADGSSFSKCTWVPRGTSIGGGRAVTAKEMCVNKRSIS